MYCTSFEKKKIKHELKYINFIIHNILLADSVFHKFIQLVVIETWTFLGS